MDLPKKPDRSIRYYKITNEEECHNNLQYHDGLVIDPVKFNDDPEKSCVPGGIYFTTKEYLHKFFFLGQRIRPVTIPENAKVILDLEGDKYRADRVFFHPRKTMKFYFDSLFDKSTFPKGSYWYLAAYCSKYFNKWFNKNIFPKEDYWGLAVYCSEYFDTWFDKSTFPEENYWYLAAYCSEHFNTWFDKNTFPEKSYWDLARYCSEYFDTWFDKNTFPKKGHCYLAKYCSKYKGKK